MDLHHQLCASKAHALLVELQGCISIERRAESHTLASGNAGRWFGRFALRPLLLAL